MKYPFIIIFMLLALCQTVVASSAKITKEKIVSGGKNRSYYLFVPDKLAAAKPVPLVVLLHGSGGNGLSLVERWKDLAEKEGLILAGPDSSDSGLWATPADGPEFLRDVVEALKARHAINARRVYLFGHSAGASYALYMSIFESQYFAAAAIHAGMIPPQTYAYIDVARRKTPIAMWVGTLDHEFAIVGARATRDALNARGFKAQLTEIPGHDHSYYRWSEKINQEAWAFLQQHELTQEPQYQQYNFK
jgi:poly(3-hydroxybutyrate) depolymerase